MQLSIGSRGQCVDDAIFCGRRVLVVEDDFLVSLSTTDLLESVGCVIVGPAVCIATARQLARSEALDAAVLDIDVAGQAVWPIAEELRRRNVPFVFLSAHPLRGGIPAPLATAPQLEKPLQQNSLLYALRGTWEH